MPEPVIQKEKERGQEPPHRTGRRPYGAVVRGGQGLWEELEFLRESIPDPEEPGRMAREYAIMERVFELPVSEQFLTSRLAELILALRGAEEAERRGESGDDQRARGVINAAMLRDSEEGRPADPRMTLEGAIARLEEQD